MGTNKAIIKVALNLLKYLFYEAQARHVRLVESPLF